MKYTHCLEVIIRFSNPNAQMVHFRHTMGDSRTRHLRAANDGKTLSIQFCDKDDDVIREVNYNFDQVLEYDCLGYVGKKPE